LLQSSFPSFFYLVNPDLIEVEEEKEGAGKEFVGILYSSVLLLQCEVKLGGC